MLVSGKVFTSMLINKRHGHGVVLETHRSSSHKIACPPKKGPAYHFLWDEESFNYRVKRRVIEMKCILRCPKYKASR